MTLAHIVLTRFNVASAGREAAVRMASGWLDRRFDLFERYCLPSVADQSVSNFQWLVYFDAATPTEFRDRIDRARRVFPFRPIFVGGMDKTRVAADVRASVPQEALRVLTTRLDNDDAIARFYFASIAQAATGSDDGTVLNFPSGLALRDGRVHAARDESNPFASLVEDAAQPETIWAVAHRALASRYRVRQIEAEAMWLQVVHGDNVTNRIKGRRLDGREALRHFPALQAEPLEESGPFDLALDRGLFQPARQLRESAIDVAKILLRR